MDEIRYIAGTLVGAGIDKDSLAEALNYNPHFIACDAGTTDAGPFSLGSGQPAFAREAVKRDLAGCGPPCGNSGVDWLCRDSRRRRTGGLDTRYCR